MPAQEAINLLSIDYGSRRVGLATGSTATRLAFALTTLPHDDTTELISAIVRIAEEEGAAAVVLGWPRGLDGQTTDQTREVEAFRDQLAAALTIPVHLQDEALTSETAAAGPTPHGLDAAAAACILQDYLDVL